MKFEYYKPKVLSGVVTASHETPAHMKRRPELTIGGAVTAILAIIYAFAVIEMVIAGDDKNNLTEGVAVLIFLLGGAAACFRLGRNRSDEWLQAKVSDKDKDTLEDLIIMMANPRPNQKAPHIPHADKLANLTNADLQDWCRDLEKSAVAAHAKKSAAAMAALNEDAQP
ncbi:MAG: hypothetical protein KAH44_12475 [Oricola sp.]|nr:hypothetical protein [Oricola sp.]